MTAPFFRGISGKNVFERIANLERNDNEAAQLPYPCSCFRHTGSSIVFPTAAAADSNLPICANCAAAIVGVGIGVGLGAGLAIYFVHRGHTSLKGCVRQTENGLSLTAKGGNVVSLVNAPN